MINEMTNEELDKEERIYFSLDTEGEAGSPLSHKDFQYLVALQTEIEARKANDEWEDS